MDEKELFRATSFIEQPPSWESPDNISAETAAENAALFEAAASRGMSGVRSSM